MHSPQAYPGHCTCYFAVGKRCRSCSERFSHCPHIRDVIGHATLLMFFTTTSTAAQVASNLWHSFDSFGGAWYSRRPHELRFYRSPSQRLQTHLTICKEPQGIENVQRPLMSCPPLKVLTSCVTAQWLGCRVYHRSQHVGRFRRPNWWRTR